MNDTENSAVQGERIRLSFGELEARLARLHEIATDKRTQFQARLRNFQKHGIPQGVDGGRGKAVKYEPGQIVEMALALEFTQLGLLPERIKEIFDLNQFPIFMAVRMAAQQLTEKGGFLPDKDRIDENMPTNTGHWWRTHDEEEDPYSMFLYFDPTALAGLTDVPEKYEDQASATFFYGGAGIVKENIVRWTAGPVIRRLALINVTAVLWSLIVRTKAENQTRFLEEVIAWADDREEQYFLDSVQEAVDEHFEDNDMKVVVIETHEDVVAHAELLKNLKGLPRPVAEAMIKRAERIIEEGKMPDENAGLSGKPMGEMTEAEMEDEIVGQMTLGGLPEMIARGAMDSTRKWRHEQRAERAAKEAAGYYVDNARIEAAGFSPFEIAVGGKRFMDLTPDEFEQELERRGIAEPKATEAGAEPDRKSEPRKAKKHGDRKKA